MMKYILIAILLLFCGCAGVTVNPETGRVDYYRIGDQQIKGLEVIKDGDKITVKMDQQTATGEALKDVLRAIINKY